MDAVDLEAWMLKANALASSVAASDADHENARAVASWLLKAYDGVAAVREELRTAIAAAREEGRAAGYGEAKADAANAVNADLSLFDEGMDGIVTIRDFVNVYKRRVALIIAGIAPADKEKP